MPNRVCSFVLILVLASGVLSSCGNTERGPVNPIHPDAKLSDADFFQMAEELSELATSKKTAVIEGYPTVGVVMPTLNHPGWIATYAGVLKGAIKNKAGVLAFSADEDVELQISIIEDLIAKKVDGIIFVPTDSEALSESVKKANAAKIPIVSLDRSTTGGKLDGLVESDNVEIGREAARQMAVLSDGKRLRIFNLQGNLATSAGIERNNGFVEEISKYNDCRIVKEIHGFWKAERGNSAVLEAFKTNPEINAIFIPSDLYLQGVIAALDQLGRLRPVDDPAHVILVSVDGQPIGIENIRKEYVNVDVGQRLITMGEQAFDMCVTIINGDEIKNNDVKIPPEVINKDNIDSREFWGNRFR